MPFVKVYIHFVWSTKNQERFLNTAELRLMMWKHIKENAKAKGIFVDHVNGYSDYCHCLDSPGIDQTIQKTMQLIKGESSRWFNQQGLIKENFQWQNDYWAASVSESAIEKVRNYIRNQETHHHKRSFAEEYEEFAAQYRFSNFKDD